MTQCSTELIKLLVAHYQTELTSLDQDILSLQSSSDNLQNHAQFTRKWQDVKDYITKINKDIIFKRQSKLVKDRAAFAEGFAYHWQTPSQGRGPRNNKSKNQHLGNEFGITNEDTESDSSMSTLSSQLP